jgi:DNA-3-methyladenine glycosylase
MKRLDKNFYLRPTLDVAKDLLGKVLVINGNRAVITETEAYIGPIDKACHAYGYKRTKRTETMFKEGGHIYVYLIYGMYCCLNIVTEKEGEPCAVLIRGIEGISGPGRLCKALGITKEHNGLDLFGPDIYIEEGDKVLPEDIEIGKRMNIDYAEEAKDFLWRFSRSKK